MIIVITVAGHEYTFKSFRDGTYGFAAPKLHTMTYEQLFFTTRVPRATYLFHVADNERCMREYGHQAVVLQTALNPVVALELLATGAWSGAGVLGPEAFDAAPFLALLEDYGEPVRIEDRPAV